MAPEKFRHKVKEKVASIFRSQTQSAPPSQADTPDPQPKAQKLDAQLDSGSADRPFSGSDDLTTPALPVSSILASISPDDVESPGKGLGWKILMQGLGALKEASVVFPPLQAATGSLLRVLEQIGEITEAREDLGRMAQRIGALSSIIQRYGSRTDDEDIRNRLEGMAAAIESQTRNIERRLTSGMLDIITNTPDAHYIVECTRTISFLVNIFEMDTALNTEARTNEIHNLVLELHDHHMLEKLSPVPGSSYNESAGSVHGSGQCMHGTRVGVLAELMAWATDPQGPSVYLLAGMAGTGKTTVARSFARLLDGQMLLGASFFCSRTSEARSEVGGIIPSLAFHLAWYAEPYARALIGAIKTNPGVTFNLRPVDFQFKTLIQHPSQAFSNRLPLPVVVIDALDECPSINAVQALLKTLTHSNRVQLKFFITSRPEYHIKTEFRSEVGTRHFRLRDVERDIVTADIAKYLRKNLHDIASAINAPGWPADTDLQELVQRTGDLFIFASTAIQYLEAKSRSRNQVQKRLDNILRGTSPTEIQTARIDALYGQIIGNAWNGIEPDEKATQKRILTTILCLREPLSLYALAGLLGEDPENIAASLTDIHSVIDVPTSLEAPVLVFHASFPDYMTDIRRAGSNTLDMPAYHAALALQCVKCLNAYLHQNLCNIRRTDTTSIIIEDIRIKSIAPHLRYASVYWGTHVSLIPLGMVHPDLVSELTILAKIHILHWLECLSLIGKLNIAVECLQKAMLFISYHDCGEIRCLLDEVRRMVPQIFKFASIYPLEVYHSALEWLPLSSNIRNTYFTRSFRSVRVGLPQQWKSCEQILEQGEACYSVAFSPDGTRIACGLEHQRIRIWNITTGEMEREITGHSGGVVSVAFSPDGSHIASGSYNNPVRIWNIRTGEMERELVGHSQVNSVAFSPDGAHIASGSYDKLVRIWNAQTAELDHELSGHYQLVQSVAFSPDGTHIASGSDDTTVCIWKVETGETERKLTGHLSRVRSVAFSPDGTRIASGSSDKTIRIWDVGTGELDHQLLGHADEVNSVGFSPDGTHIASGSDDKTVRIWNVKTGEIERELLGHSTWVRSVTFSPYGACISSGSYDKTVRIWNVETGEQEQEVVDSEWAWSVAFTLDGTRITSSSYKGTIKIWNVNTGELEEVTDIVTRSSSESTQLVKTINPALSQEPLCQFDEESGYLSLHSATGEIGSRLWMWPEHQAGIWCSDFHGTKACFGYRSGRVVLIDLAQW
ncbi:mycorrhiza-induced WD40-repeat domain protein [Mycena olivaceomarginata]|nr:mycorrhiza-induced WD40-repeat domain protein [Mycena olivaceomarginata]